jgi:hypothetical protein
LGSKVQEQVYHGSGADDIAEFFTAPREMGSNTGAKTAQLGAFFSENPDIARTAGYGFNIFGAFDKNRKLTLYTARINLKRPLDINNITPQELSMLESKFPGITRVYQSAEDPFRVVQFIAKSRPPRPYPESNFYNYAKPRGMSDEEINQVFRNQDIGNPVYKEWRRQQDENFKAALRTDGQEKLKELGYDGIVVKTMMDSGELVGPQKQYIVFDKKNIHIERKEPIIGHDVHVDVALKEGKPVPPEVLKDYPNLAPKLPKAELPNRSELPRGESLVPKLPEVKPAEPPALSLDAQRGAPTKKGINIPIDERSFEEVANPKVKAYSWENPELKPFIQGEAKRLLNELSYTVKGEKVFIRDQEGYLSGVSGQKRITDPAIARIKDELGVTYAEIREALERLIHNQGLENQALAKKIELVIDDNLSAGYRSVDGREVPANDMYLSAKKFIGDLEKSVQEEAAASKLLPKLPKAEPPKGKLPELQKQTMRRIDEATEPATLPVGMTVKQVKGNALPGVKKAEGFKFADPEIEARWASSQGMKQEPLSKRIKEGLTEFKHRATREYEHLPKNKEFAQIRFDLKKLEKQKEVSKDSTARLLQGITLNLDKEGYNVFSRKVILDDLAEEAAKGRELPFGFTAESLAREKAAIDQAVEGSPAVKEAIAQRKQVQDTIKGDYVKAMKDIGFDVSERLTNENYFHHQVLEYANAKNIAGTGSKLKTPTSRSFLRKREGSSFDINTDYLQAEAEVTAQMLHDIEVARTIKSVDKNYNIYKNIKAQYVQRLEQLMTKLGHTPDQLKYGMRENNIPMVAYENTLKSKIRELNPDALKKAGLEDWHSLIPEGYTLWQPREGNMFYMADSVPAKIAEKLYSDSLLELGIKADDLNKVLAMGQKFREFVVKDEVANTLNNIQKTTEDNVVTRASSTIMRGWKVWTLLNPRRLFKYNARNISGDADAVFVGNPSTFKKIPQATRELFQVFRANRGMTPEMQGYFNRGGMLNTLQYQELKDINELDIFKNLFEKTSDFNLWKKYWSAARLSTDFREQILRYASYLDYLEQMIKNNGRPRNFGASIPEEIMGLKDIRDRAFWLSNDLLGAYDRVSVLGQGVRRHLIPFYSWMEVNFTRYTRFAKNAARDERLAGTTGRKLVSLATRSPVIAYNVGKFAVKASAFWAALQAYNQLRFPEEEKDLPPDIQAKPHIVLGRTADGEVRYFDRLGALGDFLEWFGLDSPANDVRDFLNGKRTIKEIVVDMAKSPINKIVNAITPAYKVPAELATGKKLFPDVFKPSTVRDPADYIAQSLGLQNEFRALTGRPSKPYKESLAGLVEYRSDPEQAAYYYILDEKRRFLKKIGKGGEGSFSSPRSESLRNYKLALRYKDKEAAKKYLTEYVLLGGTDRGLDQSLSSMNPLYGLNKDEQTVFIESLNGEDRERLVKALKFFTETLAPTE